MGKRVREDGGLDPVILAHLKSVASGSGRSLKEIYGETPWSILLPNALDKVVDDVEPPVKQQQLPTATEAPAVTARAEVPVIRSWLYLGSSELECASNTRGPQGWGPGDQLECDMSISYPRFLSKRSLRINGRSAITTGTLLRVTLNTSEPAAHAPIPSPKELLSRCAERLRRHSVGTPTKKAAASVSSGHPVVLDDGSGGLKGLTFESYVATQLASNRPEDLMSVVLLLIAPMRRLGVAAPKKSSEFVGSTSFSSFSGNAFVRVMFKGRDLGKTEADVSNTIAVLLALQLAHIRFSLTETPPLELQLGGIFKLRVDVWLSPLALQQHLFVELLIGEAQAVLRNAIMGLFSRVLKWKPTKASVLWSLTGGGSGQEEIVEEDVAGGKEAETESNADTEAEPAEGEDEQLDQDELQRKNNEVFGTGTLDEIDYQTPHSPDPLIFATTLRRYQSIAFNWMQKREEDLWADVGTPRNEEVIHPMWDEFTIPLTSRALFVNHMSGELQLDAPGPKSDCFGGILADEMGLGKTVEMLSVISRDFDGHTLHRAWRHGRTTTANKEWFGGTLIVMPLSLIAQWASEIERHFNTAGKLDLKVHHYYSTERSKSLAFLCNTADIVLTTYGTVLSESSNPKSLLFQIKWRRVVLDEAHFIKSRHTRTARAIYALQAERRWCLTATPIQNTLDDVFSLFHFLKMEPWGHWSWWTKLTAADPAAAAQKVQLVTRGLLLRRTIKTIDPETNKPILTLPPKTILAVWLQFVSESPCAMCVMIMSVYDRDVQIAVHEMAFDSSFNTCSSVQSETERDFYKAIFSRAQSEFNSLVGEGLVSRNYTSVLQLLLRLRQACCHPILVYSGTASNANTLLGPIKSDADIETAVKQFAKSLAVHCGKTDGDTEAFIRKQIRRLAPRSGTNATLDSEADGAAAETCPICLDTPELPVLTHCGHIMCKECAERALSLSKLTAAVPTGSTGAIALPRRQVKVAPCPVCRTHFSALTMQTLQVTQEEEKVWPVMLKRLCFNESGEFNLSSKLRCLDEILRRILPLGYRAVVFSQWVTYLDVIQEMLKWRKIPFSRLDGSQSAEKRRQEVAIFTAPTSVPYKGAPLTAEDLFNLKPTATIPAERRIEVDYDETSVMSDESESTHVGGEARVLLASLKAGGVGLNLTSASYLFLMDSWWNPATEEQAMHRVHRIGQTLPVTIFRLYVRDSIEERILRMHEFKDSQAKSVLDAGGGGVSAASTKAWNINELRRLFAG